MQYPFVPVGISYCKSLRDENEYGLAAQAAALRRIMADIYLLFLKDCRLQQQRSGSASDVQFQQAAREHICSNPRAKELLRRELHQPMRLSPSVDRLRLKRMIARLCQQYCLVASVALFVCATIQRFGRYSHSLHLATAMTANAIRWPRELLWGVCHLAPKIARSALHDQKAVPLVWKALPCHEQCAGFSRACLSNLDMHVYRPADSAASL